MNKGSNQSTKSYSRPDTKKIYCKNSSENIIVETIINRNTDDPKMDIRVKIQKIENKTLLTVYSKQ